MRDTFSRQEWVEYTCGVATAELRFAIEDHIVDCEDCQAYSRRLEVVDRDLNAAMAILRGSLGGAEPSAEYAYEVWRQSYLPVWETDLVSHRIVRLQLFLAPLCGFGTADRAMLAAAGRSTADSLELITEREWPAFVKHLSKIVSALCGEPAGRLLWHLGQPIAPALLS